MSEPFSSQIPLPELGLWERLKGKRLPLSFDLEVTARCNFDCRHCYINRPAGDRQARRAELTLDEIGDIAGQAVELGALWCLVTGGEPLLRRDFADLYVLLKQKGLLVSVFTNASLITEAHVALFQKYPPRDIEVTVYGATPETFERVTRRAGAYAAFRRGLRRLEEAGIQVRLKAMAIRSNAHELPEIARFSRQHTKDSFRFDALLHLRYDGDAQRNAEIQAERLPPEEIVALEQADAEKAAALQKNCHALIMPEAAETRCDHLFHCGAGQSSFSVSYDGFFRLCSSLHQPDCLFDLRRGRLAEAWNRFVPAVRELRSDDAQFLSTCRACPLINLCLWCPAHAYLESGRMDSWNSYFCQVAHARAAAIQSQARDGAAAAQPGG